MTPREQKATTHVEPLSETARGLLIFTFLVRNVTRSEADWIIRPDIDGPFFQWLTQTTNPYQEKFDGLGFPKECIPNAFFDPVTGNLYRIPEGTLKEQMDFFITEATQQVDAIRYRTIAAKLFCAPRPVRHEQYEQIRVQVINNIPQAHQLAR